VLVWSLRNPQFPERVVATPSGVSSLDFSTAAPGLIAVGCKDGSVMIYDMARDGADAATPILVSYSFRSAFYPFIAVVLGAQPAVVVRCRRCPAPSRVMEYFEVSAALTSLKLVTILVPIPCFFFCSLSLSRARALHDI